MDIAELAGLFENLIRAGSVAEVRHTNPPAVRVRTGSALVHWESRLRISSVQFSVDGKGAAVIGIEVERIDGPRRESVRNLIIPLRG